MQNSLSLTRYESEKALSTTQHDEDKALFESQILQFELLKTPADNFKSYSRTDLIDIHKKCLDPTAPNPLPLTLTKRLEASLKLANSASSPILSTLRGGTSANTKAGTATGVGATVARTGNVRLNTTSHGTANHNGKGKPGTRSATAGPEEGSIEALPTKAAVFEKCMSTFCLLKAKPTAWYNDITIDGTRFDRVEIYGSDRGVAEVVLLRHIKPVILSSTSGSISDCPPSIVLDGGVHGYSIEGDPSLLHLEGSMLSNQSRPPSQVFNEPAVVNASRANDSRTVDTVRTGSVNTAAGSRQVTIRSPSGGGGDNNVADVSVVRRAGSGGELESLSVDKLTSSMVSSGDLSRAVSFRGSVPLSENLGMSRPSTMNSNILVTPSVSSTIKEPEHCPNDYIEIGRLVLTRDKVKEFQLPLPPAQAHAKDVDHFFSDMDNGPTAEELRSQWSEWFSTVQYLLEISPSTADEADRFTIALRPPFVPVTIAGRKWDLAYPPPKKTDSKPSRLPNINNQQHKIKLDSRKVYLFFRDT